MGCGGSKEAEQDGKNPNEINCDFKETKIQAFDDIFNQGKELLEQAEAMRAGLQDTTDEGKEITETWRLKEYSYAETVRVAFWSLSAAAGGKINNTKFAITEESPYITYDKNNLPEDTVKLIESVITFLKTAVKAPLTIPDLVIKVVKLSADMAQLAPEAFNKAKNAGLPLKESLLAAKHTALNAKRLGVGIVKLKRVAEFLPEATKCFKDILPNLKEIYKTADEVGAKAHASGDVKPADIFNKYHQGAKKTEEEIEAEKNAAANAAEAKKAAKEAAKKAKAEKKAAEKAAKEEKKQKEKEEKERIKAEKAAKK